jgi:hypothetical protein
MVQKKASRPLANEGGRPARRDQSPGRFSSTITHICIASRNERRAAVCRALGHSSTVMVERHYGHLSKSYIADAIRLAALTEKA